MLGNFCYYNPTKLYFGDKALENLKTELQNYGPNIQLIYGSGSIKKNGIYDKVVAILKECGKNIFEDSGVMPNPTIEKVYEGIKIARDNNVDLLLSVGGGSCCDYAKAVAASVYSEVDPWQHYYLGNGDPTCKIVPIGCVLTMTGTGSEMNTGSVITNHQQNLKIGHVYKNAELFPKFSILDPTFTYSLPKHQMIAGIYDIFNHICEQYFSGLDDNTSDYISEGLMRSLIVSSQVAVKEPTNYEARSNIMWTATWALNTLVEKGKTQDWMVHMIGHAVGAYTDATHGMTLSAVSLPYYRFMLKYGLAKFVRFAKNVWNVNSENKSDEEIANEGLLAMEQWMCSLGLTMNLKDLGVTEDMIDGITRATIILNGGFKKLEPSEVKQILMESL